MPTILIPDVHGRTFWTKAIPYIKKGIPTIFLGDYHDPYPHEGISTGDSLLNFRNILGTAYTFKNVMLLLGNHDMTYFADPSFCNCRKDALNAAALKNLFSTYRFKLCTSVKTKDKCFLISHAGITKPWFGKVKFFYSNNRISPLDAIFETTISPDNELICSSINNILECFCNNFAKKDAGDILKTISYARGGTSDYGSVIWADYYEFVQHPEYMLPYDQIVGHTMQLDVEYQEDSVKYRFGNALTAYNTNVTCIDTARCYILTDDGKLDVL